jgi:hypothetical protein
LFQGDDSRNSYLVPVLAVIVVWPDARGCVAIVDSGETWAVLTNGLVRAYCDSRDLIYWWLCCGVMTDWGNGLHGVEGVGVGARMDGDDMLVGLLGKMIMELLRYCTCWMVQSML